MRRVVLALALLSAATAHVHAQPAGDWGAKRDPFDRTLIARYKSMLTREPHDRMALSALVSLYKRHRTVELLVREFSETLATSESAATLVVLGRLARHANDATRATDFFTRATALDPKDTQSWLALGELHAAAGNKGGSREAFAKASESATTPALKKLAARSLLDATQLSGDHAAVEAAFEALLKLTPKDGRLWSERADSQLAAGQYDEALASYKEAEDLLARDPERKLLAIAARALVFDRAGKPDLAIDEYKRAQAAAPPGYYLKRELTVRIIDVFRRHHTLKAALDYLDREWPHKKRGAFEWGTIADLHKELTDTAMMVWALEQAVKADPRDVNLQWKLIKHYDATQESSVALAQLETAAAASPSDVSLNLDLAQRLWRFEGPSRRRALDIAKRLSKSVPRDVEAHRALTEVFSRFGRIDLAIEEARKVAALEPGDDSWAMLGDALNAGGRQSEAITTWKKIAASGKPAALQRVADIFLDNSLWMEAVDAYTEAMYGDLSNPLLWRGRAVALASMGRITEGRIDAEHAVKLLGLAHYDKGHEVRFQLVNILRQEAVQDAFGDDTIEPDLWIMAMDKAFTSKKAPDLQAGYLLAEYYRRKPDESLMIVLEKLHEHVPADLGIANELVRVYRQLEKLDKAIAMVNWLAAADPTRKQELAELANAIERSRPAIAARQEQEERAAAYFSSSCSECRYQHDAYTLDRRIGIRLGVGDSMRGSTAGTLTLGARWLQPLHDELAIMTRVEWVRRTMPARMVLPEATLHSIGASVGLAYPLAASDKGTMMIGAAWRTEVRLGDTMELRNHDRLGFSADATLELFPDAIPASLGMRLEQSLSDDANSTTFLLEATFDLR